jgi:putative FmdB family regulatory protein
MPVYQYQCSCCNHEFDLKQSFYDESIASCPKCQNGARRLFKPVPIIFKGSGFYVTDSARKSEAQDSPKSTSTENSEATKTDKPDETKSEKKEDVKVEQKEEKTV